MNGMNNHTNYIYMCAYITQTNGDYFEMDLMDNNSNGEGILLA